MDLQGFCGSTFWDTDLAWHTETPDLTPCFRKTVLTWFPALFLWLCAVFDLRASSNNPNAASPIPWNPLNVAKMGFAVLLAGVDLTFLLLARGAEPSFNADIYGPAIKIATYILFLALLLYSKGRGVQSSGVQSVWSLLLVLAQGVHFRSVLLAVGEEPDQAPSSSAVATYILEIVYFPVVAGLFLLHIFPDARPSYGHLNLKGKPCPEMTSSYFSQLLFHWFTPLAWKGFRKPLEYVDLWDLNVIDRSKYIVNRFDTYYPHNLNKAFLKPEQVANGTKSHPGETDMQVKFVDGTSPSTKKEVTVLYALLKAFGLPYLLGVFIKFIPDLLVFVSPQILNLLISYVESDPTKEPTWKGVFYACILFGSAFLATVVTAQATHRFYMAGMRGRTALVSAIYRKALLLSNSAKRESTVGEIVNLMSVDVQRCTEFAQFAYFLWSGPFIIGLSVYFLWGILGPASLAGLFVMVLMLPVNAIIAGKIRKLQVTQMKKKDERVKLMNEMLSGIKVLKLYAWEPCFEKQITEIRHVELDVLKKTAFLNAYSNVLWTCSPFLVAISTFGTYVLLSEENVLDAHKIFVSLSLFNAMSVPLTFLPLIIVNFVQAVVAIKRIDRYMNSEEIDVTAVSHEEDEADPIVIEKGTFAWEDESTVSTPALRDITMRVQDGAMVAVVGVVGSGKSTLLSALLGELTKISGKVNTRGTIAYVAQQAWIQNATLRDNILFGKPFDPVRYDKVIDACALRPDLEILPAGDKTEIGEKGINLSGGQKQRVALARAAYSNADLYLFDDPLSAVDAHVGKHIFEKLLGPKGILRRKTRVLVTHGVVYLPAMNNIFVLKDGQISESGTYQELVDKKGAFADFLSVHMTSEDATEFDGSGLIASLESAVGDKALSVIRERKRRPSESGQSDSEFLTSTESSIRRRIGSSVIDLAKERDVDNKRRLSHASITGSIAAGMDKLIESEKSETEGVKASVYLDYFRAAGWGITISTFFLYLTFQGFAVGANLWLSEWSAQNATQNGTQDAATRDYYLGVYGGLGVMQAIAILTGTVVMALGTVKSAAGLHLKMLKRILQAPMHFFDTTPIGRIVNRFAKDVDILDSILPLFLRYLMNGIFNVFATLVVISYSTPIFAAVVVPITLIYYFIQKFYVASSRQLKRLESVTRSPIYSHFGETISGASTIRAYRQQERFVLDSEAKVDHNQISFYCSVVANRWLAVRLETIGNTVVLFAALFAVLGRETISPGLVGLSVSYALQITGGLLMLVRFTSDVETNIVAVERMAEYSEAPQEAPWEIPSKKPSPSWPDKGAMIFNAYKTRYRPGLDLVLRNVSFSIQPGEKVGIVGRTGAGKSSLTLALFRIIEPAGGSISIDGEDIGRLGLHDVRGRITIIPQDPVLFSGTLRMNLDPFESYSDQVIWQTLELAHLKDFVTSLPAGLTHEIAEGGENLSVGQRQLVCLARALLRKTKILCLDEATAAIDLDTDDLIQATIRKEFKDATVITIAHRLNTIMDSTRVMVLDKGEVVEFDTVPNLLAQPDSIFTGMARDAGLTKQNGNGNGH
ncbi:multidrug resistance-associated protein 1 [Folsomia candida]|uniref:ABC-type glutathione-S-conjugate transporter n=1 Tax=Folsomia candida TaxID=158441 RepID=A0A226DEC6_FOLCA|nr:multidrug resistance-associated protein 1 [Folsomia candida]OXA43509.1 Multidrug resistance-associated protein 1 [Folsomia candida]